MKLYYRTVNNIPLDNFCTDSVISALRKGYECIPFEMVKDIPRERSNVVVGSVEDIEEYFGKKMLPINDDILSEYKGRNITIGYKNDIKEFPVFIKPNRDIKKFTGTVIEYERELNDIDSDVELQIQDFLDFESEYRVYVSNCRIVGVKHYLGSPYLALDESFVHSTLRDSLNFKENSYSLDFGIINNKTYLIEVNDGWAIGNYGLSPDVYFSFILERWHQLVNKFF